MASLRAFNLLFNPHANQLARTAIKKSIIPPKKPNFFALTDLENRYKYKPPINNRKEPIPMTAHVFDDKKLRNESIHTERKNLPTGSILSTMWVLAISKLKRASSLPGFSNRARS